jgi:hypothetical protein
MALTIMKLTETLAIVKVTGAGATTINLSTDLLSSTQTLSGTLKVGIGFLNWSASEPITIVRNSVEVFKLHTNANEFDLSGNGGMLDITQSDQNIVVTMGAGGGVCFLTLRKAGGYASKIEPEKFGSYDNTGAVGS